MHRGSTIWQARGAGIALSACALALGACGGSDGSEGPDGSAKAAVQGNASGDQKAGTDPAQAHSDAKKADKGKSAPDVNRKSAAGSGAGGDVSQGPQPTPADPPSTQARQPGGGGGHPKPTGKGKPNAGKKPPKVSTPPFLPGGGGDPYEVARRLCGDQQLVDLVPPEYRDDPENLARMYADIYDPANKQQAYEGCLAGLRSLGL